MLIPAGRVNKKTNMAGAKKTKEKKPSFTERMKSRGREAKRLGVSWAPNLDHALDQAREASGGTDVAAVTVPPFFYINVEG